MQRLSSYILALAIGSGVAQSPEDAVIRSGTEWLDSSGNRMYAGGANMYEEGGVYYLIGEGKKVHSDCSDCFNLYSSKDWSTWTFEGCALKNADIKAPPPYANEDYYRMERPKVFKCPGSGKYVMWFHCDTSGFAMRSVGVLTADSIKGPYTFASPCFRPDDQDSYDMGTFVDNGPGGDGKAYLVRSVGNKFAGISQMTDDCTGVTGITSQGPDMEGQAIMRDANGTLYLAGSHLTGWASNPAIFTSTASKTLVGATWGPDYNPSGDATTWDSQSTFIFPYTHADGHKTFMWMADRWNANGPGGLGNMSFIWLPMVAPTGPAPTNVTVGWTLELATCDASDPLQGFTITASNTVVHAASGLCVAQPEAGDDTLTLQACGGSSPSQTWYVVGGSAIATTRSGSGGGCLQFNNADEKVTPGNHIIAYACGGGWNAKFRVPAVGATGAIQALGQDGSPAATCASASSGRNPSQWTLPWRAAWSLKNY